MLMLFFLLRMFSSFFAMGYGDSDGGRLTLAASMKSVFDQARNAVRLAPEYARLARSCDLSRLSGDKRVRENCVPGARPLAST
jgi:hypothetical protein